MPVWPSIRAVSISICKACRCAVAGWRRALPRANCSASWMPRRARFAWPCAARAEARRASGRAGSPKATSASTPGTGPDMWRRTFLLALWCARLGADAKQQVFDLFTKIASELSGDNPMVFLESVDHDMPHFQEFQNDLMALTGQADVANSLEILSDEGDETHRTEEFD